MWNLQEVRLNNFIASEFSLTAEFHIIGTKVRGFITNIYGPFALARKSDFLESLNATKAWVGDRHWTLGEYFNLICSLDEKKGGHGTLSHHSEAFNDKIGEWGLVNLRPTNHIFNWTNKRIGNRHIASRLNRFLVLKEILTGGSDLAALVLPPTRSDHWPISLNWLRVGEHLRKPLCFE